MQMEAVAHHLHLLKVMVLMVEHRLALMVAAVAVLAERVHLLMVADHGDQQDRLTEEWGLLENKLLLIRPVLLEVDLLSCCILSRCTVVEREAEQMVKVAVGGELREEVAISEAAAAEAPTRQQEHPETLAAVVEAVVVGLVMQAELVPVALAVPALRFLSSTNEHLRSHLKRRSLGRCGF
jgi:hypothetical protein